MRGCVDVNGEGEREELGQERWRVVVGLAHTTPTAAAMVAPRRPRLVNGKRKRKRKRVEEIIPRPIHTTTTTAPHPPM